MAERKKSKKVLKYILHDPFQQTWPDVPRGTSQQFLNIFTKEITTLCVRAEKTGSKFIKLSNDHASFLKEHLMYGINNISRNINSVALIVLVKDEVNEMLLEPLMMLARYNQIPCIAIHYDLANQTLFSYTGIKKLAAFAFKSPEIFEHTRNFALEAIPNSNIRYLNPIVRNIEISSKKV